MDYLAKIQEKKDQDILSLDVILEMLSVLQKKHGIELP